METEKKKEAVKVFLETFVAHGLAETTSRDLARALHLQRGGLYYYFESKDAVVLACVEEAVRCLEQEIVVPALEELDSVETMMAHMQKRADAMAPVMRFVVQAYSSPKYAPQLEKIAEQWIERGNRYIRQAACKLGCSFENIAPYAYWGWSVMVQYVLFGNREHLTTLRDVFKVQIEDLTAGNMGHLC
jgi:AcrR family transcriptional regulator